MINETMQVSDVKINYDCQVEVLKFNQDEEDMIYRVVQEVYKCDQAWKSEAD